jgi:hypothetical protein
VFSSSCRPEWFEVVTWLIVSLLVFTICPGSCSSSGPSSSLDKATGYELDGMEI